MNSCDGEMAVRLVILDCDRTLWDHGNVSELRPPFCRTDPDTVEDAHGKRVRLLPGARELLDALRTLGILVSIVSWNRPEPVFAILDLLGLRQYFTLPKVEFHPYKDRTISTLLRELGEEGVPLVPEEVLFVDDREANLTHVRRAVGPIHTLHAGTHVRDLREVLQHLED